MPFIKKGFSFCYDLTLRLQDDRSCGPGRQDEAGDVLFCMCLSLLDIVFTVFCA
jgi:hypothetical protein